MTQQTMTPAELKAYLAKKKGNKYNAQRVKNCPHCHWSHDSKAEAAYCAYLAKQVKDIESVIQGYEVQPIVTLQGVRYSPDFLVYYGDGLSPQFVDIKGKVTNSFTVKRKLFDLHHLCAPLRVIRGIETKRGYRWEQI
jgi:hypothetical protein